MDASRGCAHCGLPTTGSYCCLGCELAHRIAREGARDEHRTAAKLTVALLLSMSVMMLSLFLYAEDVYGATSDPGMRWLQQAYRFGSGLLSSIVVVLLAPPVARRGLSDWWRGHPSMEGLIAVGALAAYGVSLAALVSGAPIYFDSASAALTLVAAGRYVEAVARQRACRMLGPLVDDGQRPITVVDGASGRTRAVAATDLEIGMQLLLAPEQMLPVDATALEPGEVSLGISSGESRAAAVAPGDALPAGAIVLGAPLVCRVERPAHASTLARLSALSDRLRQTRGRIRRNADRLAAWLTPLVLLVALAAAAYWTHSASLARGIDVALAVLLVACPCTYGVITPLSLWLALRRANRAGVCVRDAEVMERLAAVRRVAFDKTGTLTAPLSRVATDAAPAVWPLVAALEADSRHPVGRALASAAGGVTPAALTERRIVAGGVTARDDAGRRVVLGSRELLRRHGVATPPESDGARAYLARLDERPELLASFAIEEVLRDDAAEAVAALSAMGIDSALVSGDTPERVAAAAQALGISGHAALAPEQKVERLRALGGGVALVGDGINDAPALAAAHVSFAVVDATQLARCTADVVLLDAGLGAIADTIALARRTVARAWRSLLLVTGYNALFVAIAAAGWLRPVWAGVAMLVASLTSLAGAARIWRDDAAAGPEPVPRAEEVTA